MIHPGDCLEVMAGMEAESFDAIVTDPPYGLEFMGKAWDRLWDARPTGGFAAAGRVGPTYKAGVQAQAFHAAWGEAAFRVARPSAYLLAFGGTRTVHRMTVALEDAGWVIRDMLVWAYASGFPKSKASLKPAWEPIVMARKPGPARDLAIDACRLPISDEDAALFERGAQAWHDMSMRRTGGERKAADIYGEFGVMPPSSAHAQGRWPANVLLTDPIFDGDTAGVIGGGIASTGSGWAGAAPADDGSVFAGVGGAAKADYTDGGTYSRFFIIPKAHRGDREPVLGELSGLDVDPRVHAFDEFNRNVGNVPAIRRRNSHPTVKPTELMRHLIRLVTPIGGRVLDPFLGSGTTGIAAEMEGFDWAGIEREAEYVAIAEARLNGTQRGFGL